MITLPKFCSQCTTELVTRLIEGRQRQVCPTCETIFYRNPLPVVACLVVRDDQEVLLVKRRLEPQKGRWCLPIGFAEIGETIEQAALRELKEEAGVVGRVIRLLDAYSSQSDFYGDVLTISYEVQQIGGTVQAGDDAEDAAWYSFDALPPLAFSSNDRAIDVYRRITTNPQSTALPAKVK